MGLGMREMFFDREAVMRHVPDATRRVLSRFGAYVRSGARSSVRRRKAAAPPGSPPSSHTGLLKKFIFFGYDPAARSVVIGPERLGRRGAGTVPSLLEHGGGTTLEGGQPAHYRPRPFMGPAFEREQPKLPAMWRDSIR